LATVGLPKRVEPQRHEGHKDGHHAHHFVFFVPLWL
jgi:hypothetical protein